MAFLNDTSRPEPGCSEAPRLSDALVITVVIGLFFALLLGSRPLSVPDEGRYAAIPREMIVTGDWLTPRSNGVVYFEKPPLVYWLTAVSIALFGLSEWSLRLVPSLFGLAGCLIVYFAGAKLFGRRAGVLAAVVLSTSFLFYALSRLLTLDMPLTVLVTAALLSFLLGTRESSPERQRIYFLGCYVFAALATLTKGLLGIVLPFLVIGSWMLLMGDWRQAKSVYLPGLVLFLLIAAPWHLLMALAHPGFVDFYFIREHFNRFLTTMHNRYKPFWFFIPILAGGLFPWTAFLFPAVKQGIPVSWTDRRRRKEAVFLLLWAGLAFLFFSASSSKLIPYILPVLPPLALLIGSYLSEAIGRTDPPGLQASFVSLAVLSALLCAALVALPFLRPREVQRDALPFLAVMILLLLAGALGAWFAWKKKRVVAAVAVIALSAAFLGVTASAAMPLLDTKTVKPLALSLKERLRPGDEVISYHGYYWDLPIYLDRRITVVKWKGELLFGSGVEDVSSWMITDAQFRERWSGANRIYLFATREDYEQLLVTSGYSFYPIAANGRHVVVSNKKDRR